MVYTSVNHKSRTLDGGGIEGQIRPVLNWVIGNVNTLSAGVGTSAGQTVPYPAGHDEP
ncbi:hypothetical protein LAJ19_09450 [Deinococcus taeanensis]|uniref:hypothetical protein n=1 Tax=Deinococcus taeanensis TaxID=2737050 RepID=UPI001CDD886C|nr:hypothetical protein [Deinococcus taeanensis]UBV41869.1 hypothetical protein LAJ19_09450 [Deinococcus taeanensis]